MVDTKTKILCAVCGMECATNNISANYQGKEYHFCGPDCKNDFLENPEEFLDE